MNAAEWLSDSAKGIARTVRPAQVQMATLVEKTLQEKGIALIEAGTGTGKSFGYLVPALLSGKRVVVSTAKKALQRQLRDNDLPFLFEKLAVPRSYASLKGKNNYVCAMRYFDFKESDHVHRFGFDEVEQFSAWIRSVECSGELDDFKGDVPFASHVRVSECVSRLCEYADDCSYRAAKAEAMKARIVVVNHALLAFDLYMGGGKIIGPYDALVIDEAHQAAKYFREAYTCRIHNKQPEALRKLLQDTEIVLPETLEARVHAFLSVLPQGGLVRPHTTIVEKTMALAHDLERLKRQFMAIGVWSEPGDNKSEEEDEASGRSARELARLRAAVTVTQRMLQACAVCAKKLDTQFDGNGEEIAGPQDYVSFVETKTLRNEPHLEFVATPIEIGPFVGPQLRKIDSVIATSATLSTSGNFNYVLRDLGIRPEQVKASVILPQPFDYAANSRLFVSNAVVEYKRDTKQDYWWKCADIMHELLSASKGGAFILCASREDMVMFYDHLSGYKGRTYELNAQGSNVDSLIEWFKAKSNRVAIGLKSIWEGVDIPGLQLRLVIIPRLPFPSPEDPVFTARKSRWITRRVEKGADQREAEIGAWQQYDLQETIMDFKQGAGRLIRRETDMGIVAVLDSRAYGSNKRYGHTVRNSLPHPTTYDLDSTKKFLALLSTKV